jgi:SAM-dependent methyltransferase
MGTLRRSLGYLVRHGVRAAVEREHLEWVERRQERTLVRAYLDAAARDARTFVDAISPHDEMYRVTWETTPPGKARYHYFQFGRENVQCLDEVLAATGKTFARLRSFLDFAAGWGRTTRFLVQEMPAARIWVSDIDERTLDFQRRRFGVHTLVSAVDPARVTFPCPFEVIYAGSLFTHLPRHRFRGWLSRLHQALEPDGVLIFSTSGLHLCPANVRPDPSGFTFMTTSETTRLPGEEYGSTVVTTAWMRQLARELALDHLYFLERGLCGGQDLFVVSRRAISSLVDFQVRGLPQGSLDVAHLRDGNLHVRGWAADRHTGAPVHRVGIHVNGLLVGCARTGLPRRDVAQHYLREDFMNSGWEFVSRGSVARIRRRPWAPTVVHASVEAAGGTVLDLVTTL